MIGFIIGVCIGFPLGLFAFGFWLCAVDDCAVSLPTKRDAT
jgi:hypothetical protein